MPGSTEPQHLYSAVYVANDGVFWHVAANSDVTLTTSATIEAVEVVIEDNDISIQIGE